MAKVKTIIGSAFPHYVGALVEGAKKSIDIIVFDWRWYPNTIGCAAQIFSQKIVSAAKRKVKVRVIGNHADTMDILAKQGILAKKLQTARLVHVKMMIIDGEHVIIGSHNYTQSAFSFNLEASAHIEDPVFADESEMYFNTLWQ